MSPRTRPSLRPLFQRSTRRQNLGRDPRREIAHSRLLFENLYHIGRGAAPPVPVPAALLPSAASYSPSCRLALVKPDWRVEPGQRVNRLPP